MAIRLPLTSVINVVDTATTGTVLYPFTLPQDIDGAVAKIFLSSTWSATGTATITIQTTEDGGTTWRDVAATTIGASTVAASVGNQNAHFIPIPVVGSVAHGIANYVGSVAASTLALAAVSASAIGVASGLPFLSQTGRIQIVYTATITTGGVNVQILAQSQATHQ